MYQLAPAGIATPFSSKKPLSPLMPIQVYRCKCNRYENSEVFRMHYLLIEASQISVLPHAVEDLRSRFHHLRCVSAGKHRRVHSLI